MAETPAVAAEQVPAQTQTPEPRVTTVDANAPGSEPAKPAEAEKPTEPERTFTQKELDEIIEKRLSKERKKRDDLRQERDVLRKLALEGRDRPQAQQHENQAQPAHSGEAAEPKRESFSSYEEFIEARAEWRADKAVERKLKERDEGERQRSERVAGEKAAKDFRKLMQDSAAGIDDFDDVVSGIAATDPVANIWGPALEACEKPGKMLYHLATHPEEAERIASLSVGQQAREVLKLEQQQAKPAPKPSKAPEPIEPVGGRAAVGDEMPDASKDPKGWLEWRNRTLTAQRGKVRAS